MAKDFTKHSESTAPTDEQLEEAAEFLEMVMEIGAPQNEWEQQAVRRLHDVIAKASEAKAGPSAEKPENGVAPQPGMW